MKKRSLNAGIGHGIGFPFASYESLVLDLQALRAFQGQAFLDVAEIEAVEHIGAAADYAGFGRGGGKTREFGVIGIIA
jgi:hypothetical protein